MTLCDTLLFVGPPRLLQDQRIFSYNRSYSVVPLGDGQVVVHNAQNQVLWSSNSMPQVGNPPPPYSLSLLNDGNLVLYGGYVTNNDHAWTH